MGSVPPELSLEFRPTFVPKTISDFLKEVSMIWNVKERVSKIDDFVKCLEEEMRKIEAFKRELPLCMLLLNDATIALKKETVQCAAQNNEPVLEEFIPLKNNCDENEEKDHRDKKNWMSCVQLWTTDTLTTSDHPNNPKQNSKVESKRNAEEIRFVTEDSFQSSKTRLEGSANMPFKAVFPRPVVARKESKEGLLHGLSLLTPGMKNLKEESGSSGSKTSCSRSVSSAAANVNSLRSGSQQQTPRKQRRCWSPELHRRFVSALSQLGGSQATPKQIRELMQVDGLTNDEVKSHLQKYRLHTRRLPAASNAPANPSVCVLGGLWMPQDQYDDSSKGSSSQSGSPQGPLQLGGTGGGTSTTGGDSMDDDEEESESYSWKNNAHKSGKDDV